MDNNEMKINLFEELKGAFKYLFQSARGKYSLETYLEILSEFTDDEINTALDNGDTYAGGEAVFYSIVNSDTIHATVEMRFYNENDLKVRTKKAERDLERKIFTDEALATIDRNGETAFEIKVPRRM